MFSTIASFLSFIFFQRGGGRKTTWMKFQVTGADIPLYMFLLLLTAVCTSCRLQHTKARKESDFDDEEGAEKVSSIPISRCKCCSSFVSVGVTVWGVCACVFYLRPLTWTSGCVVSLNRKYLPLLLKTISSSPLQDETKGMKQFLMTG